jgi:hypothetical protein
MYDENTREEPRCVICGSVEDCGHLVACIDHTWILCDSGALYERDWEFRSEIETAFLKLLETGKKTTWQHSEVEELWSQARADYDAATEDLMLDGYVFFRLMVELLRGAGAIDYPGPVVDDGPPGFSCSYSLLYADTPNVVVDKALKNLRSILIRQPER